MFHYWDSEGLITEGQASNHVLEASALSAGSLGTGQGARIGALSPIAGFLILGLLRIRPGFRPLRAIGRRFVRERRGKREKGVKERCACSFFTKTGTLGYSLLCCVRTYG